MVTLDALFVIITKKTMDVATLIFSYMLFESLRVESGKQRANHFAMARYLAIDLAEELKAEADRLSWSSDDGERLKRPRLDEDNSEGDVDVAQKVRQLEGELNEMTDELNDLITRECQINDELQGVRRELIKGLNDILKGNHVQFGIKNMGEIDTKVFISEMEKRFPTMEAQMRGVELCSLWKENLKNPLWHPYQIIVDDNGKPKRMLKDDDPSLQDLKKKWGQEIHDAVVGALNDLHDYNPSGCYVVPELWNFKENRKAKLDEVISYILEAVKDVSKVRSTSKINNARTEEYKMGKSCLGRKRDINASIINNSDEEIDTSDSEIYECKKRIYELLKSCNYQVSGPRGELRCPFCWFEEDCEYNYLLRHALMVAEGSSESAEQRGKHFALAKYLVIDLQDNAQPPPQSRNGEDEEIAEEVFFSSSRSVFLDELKVELNDATMNEVTENSKKFDAKRRLKSKRNPKKLSRQMISQYFHMPIAEAAGELNIGLGSLKKRCRELGIQRWPRREHKSLQSRNKNVQESSEKVMLQESLEILEQEKKLKEIPDLKLKRLRKAFP